MDDMDDQDDRMTMGSGNVFRDTGATEPDARLAKVELAGLIMDIVDEEGWSQKDAADRFGIDQPNMSRILSGRLRGFSIERLIQLIANAGYVVRITVEHSNVANSYGSIHVARRDDESRGDESSIPGQRDAEVAHRG